MAVTTVLFVPVAQRRFGWPAALALGAVFLTVDLAFLGANVPKIPHGGAFPLLIGLVLFTVMTTWKRGTELLNQHLNDVTLPLTSFIADVARAKPLRVPGTAVFMSGYPDGLPLALGHHFKHSKVLHERIVLLSIVTEHVSRGARARPRARRAPRRGLRARDSALRLHADALDRRRAAPDRGLGRARERWTTRASSWDA